jgi:hypothetical protein
VILRALVLVAALVACPNGGSWQVIIAVITARSNKSNDMNHFFVSKYITELKLGEYTRGSYLYPLYLYEQTQDMFSQSSEPVKVE